MDEHQYKEITKIISKDLDNLTEFIKNEVSDETKIPIAEFRNEIKAYLTGSSKRIRAALIFLFAHLLYGKIDNNILKLAAAVEIIHNATLIHDDIIDSAQKRRGNATFHTKYDNRLAIIAGDYLLSAAISLLAELNSLEIISNFSKCIVFLCKGEVEQYFSKNITPSMEEYLEKTEAKTASLFIAGLKSLTSLNNDKTNEGTLHNFARHFGRAFQLQDDISNITCENDLKPLFADIGNGIYTAPVIFAFGENKDLTYYTVDEIIEKSKNFGAVKYTENLLNAELNSAQNALLQLPKSVYSQAISDICNLMKK